MQTSQAQQKSQGTRCKASGKELINQAFKVHFKIPHPSDNLRHPLEFWMQNDISQIQISDPNLFSKSKAHPFCSTMPTGTSTPGFPILATSAVCQLPWAHKASFFCLSPWFMTISSHHRSSPLPPSSSPPPHPTHKAPSYLTYAWTQKKDNASQSCEPYM